jgi:Spy/CpxP family protein refolding chaperone
MKSGLKYIAVAALFFAAGFGVNNLTQKHSTANYADLVAREIKSLSAEDVSGLKEGKGLGYALAAELNGYPGPRHVLELANKLSLTPDQKQKTEALFSNMKVEAAALGEQLITAERNLDQGFTAQSLDAAKLDGLTQAAAAIDGKLRATHLRYHLAMMDVLTPQQITEYVKARGYAGRGHSGH